jgi:hypothetical protein
MCRRETIRRQDLRVEALEGRALMTGFGVERPHAARAAIVARTGQPLLSSINSAALHAIFSALGGGPGSEFIKLIQSQVRNPLGIAAGFSSGAISQYSIKGFVIKKTNWQAQYTGFPHDPLALTAGGGVVLKKKRIELGAIVRGPFTTYPGTTEIVFALNRGAGQRLGPYYASRPGITPDALVTVTVGPYGQNDSATITDLTSGSTQPIGSFVISVAGPTVRILLDASQLPSEGFKLSQYTFAVWTETQTDAPIQDVGSFVPEDSMIPIGVETNLKPTI